MLVYLWLLLGTILVTLVVSILLCRHRIAQKEPLFFVTALASALIANVVVFVLVLLSERIYDEGWHIFSLEAWKFITRSRDALAAFMFTAWSWIGVGTLICILPALGVAYYYKRRSKKNGIHVA